MEEIPEILQIVSPRSDDSPKLTTPKNEKSIYIKELNIFKINVCNIL